MTVLTPDDNLRAVEVRRGGRRLPAGLAFALNNGLLIVLVIEIVAFSLALGGLFWSPDVLVLIVQNSAVVGIIMPFYVCCLIAGQIDLSNIGSLGAVLFATLMLPAFGMAPGLALVCALGFGAGVGLLSSWLIIKVKVPALVATLAVGTLSTGLGYLITDFYGGTFRQIKISVPALRELVIKGFAGTPIPMPVYLMLLLYLLAYVVLNHTKFGAHLYAVGGNRQAAHLCGVNVAPIIAICLAGSAFGTVLASVFLGVRLLSTGAAATFSAATASTGSSAIPVPLVAAVIAGVSLSGGSGKIERTLLGVLFFSVLTIGMGMLNLPPQVRVASEGAAIVLAIVLDSIRQHLESR